MKIRFQKTRLGKENRIPIKILLLYLVVTFLFFAIGPIKYYYVESYTILILFMLVFIIVGYGMYDFGTRIIIRKPRYNIPYNALKIVSFSCVYSALLFFLVFVFDAKNHGFSFSFSAFTGNLFATMAETYSDVSFITSPARYLASYTSWVEVIAFVGGTYYHKQLKWIYRICLYATIFFHVFDVVFFVGSQKMIMDMVIYLAIPFLIYRLQQGKKASRKTMVLLIVGAILLVLIIGNVILARYDLWAVRYHSTKASSGAAAVIDQNNFLYKILPSFLSGPFVAVMRYLSQGYRGLALCLTVPFEWSKGFGFSFKWMNDFSKWFSVPLYLIENSYPVRMEAVYGIKAYASWHTIFPWFASDLTWPGAIIIVGFFLLFWGKAWREALHYESLPALIMFSHLCIFTIYIPCNNQLFQTRVSITTTIMVFLIWYLYHGVSENPQE